MECLIKSTKGLEAVCRELEDLGFAYHKKLQFSYLPQKIYMFTYEGMDYIEAKKYAENRYNVKIEKNKVIRTCP